MYLFTGISLVLLVLGIAASAIALMMWRIYKQPGSGGKILFWLHAAIAQWALSALFESAASTVPLKLFWSQIAYLGTASVPSLFFLLALIIAYPEKQLSKPLTGLVMFYPICIIIAAVTKHSTVWTDITIVESSNLAIYSHGPMFWSLLVYSYLMMLMAIITLLMALQRLPWCGRRRALFLLITCIIPLTGNIVYVFGKNPIPGFDWTLIGFLVSSLAMAAAVIHGRIFDLVPIARNHAMENMADGMLIVSSSGRFIDLNKSLLRDLDLTKRPRTGIHSDHLLDLLGTSFLELTGGNCKEVSIKRDREEIYYDIEINTMFIGMSISGYSFVLRDVTEIKKLQKEKDGLIEELQTALKNIRALHGLLPICYSCKKVRNDQGYWESVEQYIRDHADVQISHGLCPDCYNKELERLKLLKNSH